MLAPLGCGDDGDATDDATDALPEDCEGRSETFTPGMTKRTEDDSLDVTLVAAEPAPPANASSVWTLRLARPDGAVIEGASIDAAPSMPDHPHGAPPGFSVESGAGLYTVAPITLTMPGLWEIALHVVPPGESAADVVFAFCVTD